MKKILIGIGFMAFSLIWGMGSSVFAQTTDPEGSDGKKDYATSVTVVVGTDLVDSSECRCIVPPSCYTPRAGMQVQALITGEDRPETCGKEVGNFGLLVGTSLSQVATEMGLENPQASTFVDVQRFLNEKVPYPEDGTESVGGITCKNDPLLQDAKYGVCTRAALFKYCKEVFYESAKAKDVCKVDTTVVNKNETPPVCTNYSTGTSKEHQGWVVQLMSVNQTSSGASKQYLGSAKKYLEEKNLTVTENGKVVPIKYSFDAYSSETGMKDVLIGEAVSPDVLSESGATSLKKQFLALEDVKNKNKFFTEVSEEKVFSVDCPKPQSDLKKLTGLENIRPKYIPQTKSVGDATDITRLIQKIIRTATLFIAALAVLMLGWNGLMLVMAAGEADLITKAKKGILWSLVALLLAIFAYVIVKTAISVTYLESNNQTTIEQQK